MEGNPDYLEAEDDDFFKQFHGQLSFDGQGEVSASMFRDPSTQSLGLPFEDGGKSVRKGPANLAFDVVNAQVVKDGRHKYVAYTITMTSCPGVDKSPITICRRYSDLDNLNSILKKKYSHHLSSVSFPRKLVTGNFNAENVAQRSRAFEQYLTHLYSIDEIRVCREFSEFFYGEDLKKAYELIPNGQYEKAISLLQNVVNIEKKILGCNHRRVVDSLCALAACNDALDREQAAHSAAEAALCCIGDSDTHPCLLPLLNLSIRLCWKLGKNKIDLETRLQRLRESGQSVNNAPSMLQVVVRRFQPHHR